MANSEFPFLKIGKKGRWEKRTIESISDGERRHWPGKPTYRPSPDENYLIKLAEIWNEKDGIKIPGVQWYIDKLPDGYATFETDQPGGSQVYKRLFGHPSGRFFDSIPTFTDHFLWLMGGMEGDCNCKLCGKKAAAPPVHRNRAPRNAVDPSKIMPTRHARQLPLGDGGSSTRDSSATGIAAGRARRDVKQSGAPYAQDEEGTEDVFKHFVKRVEGAKDDKRGIDVDIEEKYSLDWRAEHEHDGVGSDLLPAFLTQIEHQHSFIPRVGELVLWCANFLDGHYLMLNTKTSQYMYYSFEQEAWHGFPDWRAGTVTAVPCAITQNGPVDFPDILDAPSKKTSENTAGFRVETLPDPNDPFNKGMSKQYRFVPLRNIRPLSHWQSLLRRVPEKKIHTSIRNAFTCMTSISLVEKFKAVGQWPAASIFCKGVYLGAELIIVGDTIRLLPSKPGNQCRDVMIVESVRLNLEDMKPEHVYPNSPFLCSRSSITFVGRAFTLDKDRQYEMPTEEEIDDEVQQVVFPKPLPLDQVKTLFRPVGTAEYGQWYELHPTRQRYEVSHDQVLGRLHEADAVRLWTCQLQHKPKRARRPKHEPLMWFDMAGITAGRQYAARTDDRAPEPQGQELSWFWADTRAEALAVETFNGVEVGKYHDVRNKATLNTWNAQMQILNGRPITNEVLKFATLPVAGTRGRKPGSRLHNGKVIYPGDPEYEAVFASSRQSEDEIKPRPNSNMAGAALASADEEDYGVEDEDGNDELINVTGLAGGVDMLQQFMEQLPKQAPKKDKRPLSKVQIMQSVEDGNELDDYASQEEEAWLHEPLPPARGGTEESETGDYHPENSQKM
jgi:Transcription-silencing protein Clr2/Transcription-silencing protein, cryptic loci regulator Clr2